MDLVDLMDLVDRVDGENEEFRIRKYCKKWVVKKKNGGIMGTVGFMERESVKGDRSFDQEKKGQGKKDV